MSETTDAVGADEPVAIPVGDGLPDSEAPDPEEQEMALLDTADIPVPRPPVHGECIPCAHVHVNRCWQSGWHEGYEAAVRDMQVMGLHSQIRDLKSRLEWAGHVGSGGSSD